MSTPRDHHSPSHLSLAEFAQRFIDAYEGYKEPLPIRKEFAVMTCSASQGDDEDDKRQYRAVFWFDN